MPNIAYYHPQLVHFVVALAAIGVALRIASFTGRARWTHPAALTLLLVAAIASVLAAQSGDQAHGLPERIPGARDAVVEHEEWGERTRNVFLVIAALELAALALGQRKAARAVRVVSALAGVGGLFVLYEAAEHGGELVYSYAGGVGTRSGDTADVARLLVAGLYHQAVSDRAAGRPADAARLVEELGRRRPDDQGVQLLLLESRLKDLGDATGALAALHQFTPPADNRRLTFQHKALLAQAYAAAGFRDSALTLVNELKTIAPTSPVVQNLARQIEGK